MSIKLDQADFYFDRVFTTGYGLLRCGLCIGSGVYHATFETTEGEVHKRGNCFESVSNWIAETIRDAENGNS